MAVQLLLIFSSLLIAIIVVPFIKILVALLKTYGIERKLKDQGVPSPSKCHPIFGHSEQIVGISISKNFEKVIKSLDYPGMCWLRLFHKPMLSIADPDLAKQVMTTINLPKDDYEGIRPLVGESLLTMSGDPWHQQRKRMNPAFSPTFLKTSLAPYMIDIAMELRSALEPYAKSGEPCDIHEWLSRFTMDVIGKVGFGHSFNFTKKLDDNWSKKMVNLLGIPSHWTINPVRKYVKPLETWEFYSSLKAFQNLTKRIIEITRSDSFKNVINGADTLAVASNEKSDKSKNILSLLVKSYAEDELDSPETKQALTNEISTFLIAGHETTASLLSFTFYLLHRFPEVKKKILQEIDAEIGDSLPDAEDVGRFTYMTAVLKEVLRLYPIAPGTARVTRKTEKIGNIDVPAGCTIFVSFYTLHRHPKLWENPDKFIPERFLGKAGDDDQASGTGNGSAGTGLNYKYIPFAAGPRVCIGQYFAMIEAKLTLAIIMQKFDWTVHEDPGKPGDPNIEIAENLTIRPAPYKICLKIKN